MDPRYRRFSTALLYCLLIFCSPGIAHSQNNQLLSDADLLNALRQGGNNLYIRHVATNWNQSDSIGKAGDWESCDPVRVRQLSDSGKRDAENIGKAIKSLNIKIAAIYASPYCRTRETASLMKLGKVITTTDLMNMRTAHMIGGRDHVIKQARSRLANMPEQGTNTLLSSHGNLARAATAFYPQEGEILVFKPEGKDGFTLIGRIPVGKWTILQTIKN